MSNGPYGYRKTQKWLVRFWIWGVVYQRVIVDRRSFAVFVSTKALKVAISVPKIHFCSNFDQKHFFWIFMILESFMNFLIFSILSRLGVLSLYLFASYFEKQSIKHAVQKIGMSNPSPKPPPSLTAPPLLHPLEAAPE